MALFAAMLMFADPAYAAPEKCMSDKDSDTAQIVPANGGGYRTRSVTRQQARNTWQDWIWRGEMRHCSKNAKECTYTWHQSKSTTSGWSVGGSVTAGNASSPTQKWYNFVFALLPSYNRTTTVSTDFDWSTTVNPGSTAQPVQVVWRRWVQGDFVGGWKRLERGCNNGKVYEWQPNVRFGNWTENQKQSQSGEIAVDGKV